jgi:hypothetical protein
VGLESSESNPVGAADLGQARESFHGDVIPGDNDLCDGMILKDLTQRIEGSKDGIAIYLNPLVSFIIVYKTH